MNKRGYKKTLLFSFVNKMKKLLILLCFLFIHQVIYPVYFKHLGMSDGLSQVSVMSIYQDQLGRMWFGTREGLSVYDGERMRVYKGWENPDQESSINVLLGHECDHLVGNRQGDIFFRTCDSLVRYDIREEKFYVIGKYKAKTVTSSNGDIWTGYDGMICRYDEKGDSLLLYTEEDIPDISSLLVSGNKIWVGTYEGLYVIEKGEKARCLVDGPEFYRLFESSSGEVWAGCRTGGLYRIMPDEKVVWYSDSNAEPFHLESNQIRSFAEDRFGNIWFGTFLGLHKYNPYTDKFTVYRQDHLPGSLSHSSVFSVYIDTQATIWVGTYYGGANYFNPEKEIFAHYTDNPFRKECLNYSFVGHLAEDKNGNIWICTEGGGLNFMDRKTRTFKYFTAGPSNSVLQNNLKCIAYDEKRDQLYIGTHHGGLTRFDIKTGIFHNYLDDYEKEDVKPDGIIFHTMIHNDKLYVSAMNGTFVMDLDTGEFKWLCRNAQNFTIDKEENIWIMIGTSLIRIKLADPDNQKKYFLPQYGIQFEPKRIITTNNGDIYFVVLGGGLYRYDKQSDSFIHYSQRSGHLLSNYCYNVAETNSGELLVTSDKGITFLNPSNENTRFVTLGTNLPITSIADGCGILVCRNNELFVGGNDGLASFFREDLDQKEKNYSLYFSELYIHNERIYPGAVSGGILKESFPFNKSIHLNNKQNNLIINFATTNYIDIQKNNEYQYKLVGFDEDWVSSFSSSIYYTNLDPGKYKLLVREKILPQHLMNRREISLNILIAQPWYNTVWAWILYTLTTIIIVYLTIRTINARRRLALSLEKEREEKERNEELNQAKLRFFTNISHEFRTPLTLIFSQVDMLLQSSSLPPTLYNRIVKISKNATRMRNMISELLEFRKLEQNYVSLRVCEQNLVPFLKDIYLSYCELAAQRTISFNLHHEEDDVLLWFDSNQLQKVFYNLLSNAFKYTKPGGVVDLYISPDENNVHIKVIDTGIGLSSGDVSRIFDRFYQAENGKQLSEANPGTGLGLALSKNIVNLHHGEITVQSQLGYGTIFTITLLKGKAHFENDGNTILLEVPEEPMIKRGSLPDSVLPEEYKEVDTTFPDLKVGSYKILIVEDNEELLQILNTLFTPFYQVILAGNGEEGLRKTIEEKPDLVVSDVMMPLMSGMEMCMKIKNNIDLCHIPVVLLTALDSVEYNIEGFQQGADDYVSKPFHARVLLMRCNNLIRNRLLLKSRLTQQGDFDVQLLASTSLDQKLLNRIVEIIDEHMGDQDFDVNILARELNMGRSSFFAKMKNLTGMTPSEFIQNQRIKRAAVLLQERPDMLVSEISDQLGFVSTIYFSRCFKTKFGVSPAQFRKKEK